MKQFEEEIKQEQVPTYRIQASVCGSQYQSVKDGLCFYPLLYSLPKENYQSYSGYDMALSALFEEAIRGLAASDLNVVMSTPFDNHHQGQTGSFLVLAPVFSNQQNRIMRRLPDKCESVLGYVAMEIDFADVIQIVFYKHMNFSEYLVAELYDLNSENKPLLVASSSESDARKRDIISPGHNSWEYRSITPVFMFGRAYACVSHSKPEFHSVYPLRNTWIAGVVSLIGVIVFSAIAWFWRNQQNILRKTVKFHTKQISVRVKELSALENVNRTLNTGLPIRLVCSNIADHLRECMQFPEAAFSQIELQGEVYTSGSQIEKFSRIIETDIMVFRKKAGVITVESTSENDAVDVNKLVKQVSQLLGGFLEKKEIELAKEKADKALQENFESLRQAQNIAGMGSWELDLVKGVTQWSENNYRIMGFEPHTIIPTFELFKSRVFPEDVGMVESSFKQLQATLTPLTYEIRVKKNDGSLIWLENYVVPVVEDGKIVALKGVNVDITQRKLFEDTLIEARRRAEAGDRLKSAFMNNISHEIRTPLNGILGFGQMMAQPGLLESERVEYLKILKTSIDRLINTVTDYMDISLIVSGNLNANMKDFAVSDLLVGLKQAFTPECDRKGLELKLIIPTDSSNMLVHADWELLKKAITHLLSNAVKFTNQGSVAFGFDVRGSNIEFFISDTGIGIENEALEMVLEAFVQEDMKISRNYEGSGLGLSIARGIIHQLGGEMKLESEKGKGTTARFSIPANKSKMLEQPGPSPEKPIKSAKRPLVLIAEDDLSNYLYLEVLLKKSDMQVLHAKNGSEAVGLCKQHPEINLVLMDIKMPVMDGLEATRQIKEFRKSLPIIAITAYAQTGDEFRIREAGCDDYLAKPVKMNDLKALINKILG